MNKDETKILNDAKASNGGGVQDIRYPKVVVDRMVRQGYLSVKKGSPLTANGGRLMVITRTGREALDRNSVERLVEDEGRKGLPGSTIQTGGAPWDD